MARLIHPSKLEYKVGKSTEETYDCDHHSKPVFAPSPESCHEEDNNGNGNGSNCDPFLGICETSDDDQELDSKGEEEEEIKLQQSDIDLDIYQQEQEGLRVMVLLGTSRNGASFSSQH